MPFLVAYAYNIMRKPRLVKSFESLRPQGFLPVHEPIDNAWRSLYNLTSTHHTEEDCEKNEVRF